MFRLGLVINPWAGVGGPAGLKGSDQVADQAMQQGGYQRAAERTQTALNTLISYQDQINIVTAAGDMGAAVSEPLGFATDIVYTAQNSPTQAQDTIAAAKQISAQGVDLLVFVGGDGTARDIATAIDSTQPVLGIPSGVKMHSSVYAINPQAAGELIATLINAQFVSLKEQEVRDIDEVAFREGRVRARHYADLSVPQVGGYLQSVKQGGIEQEEMVIAEIADYVAELTEPDAMIIAGPGSTTRDILDCWHLTATLLGVDVVVDGVVVAADVNGEQLTGLVSEHQGPVYIMVTAIGGQGHVFGRGNQVIGANIIKQVPRDQLLIVASRTKLNTFDGRPLLVDTNDAQLDAQLRGYLPVIAGYRDQLMYPVSDGTHD